MRSVVAGEPGEPRCGVLQRQYGDSPDERDALRMLADSPNGSAESIMLAHGFAIGMLRALVRNAQRKRRTARAGGQSR